MKARKQEQFYAVVNDRGRVMMVGSWHVSRVFSGSLRQHGYAAEIHKLRLRKFPPAKVR